METSLYEIDFYRWTVEQSQFLVSGQFDSLNLVNLVEGRNKIWRLNIRSKRREINYQKNVLTQLNKF